MTTPATILWRRIDQPGHETSLLTFDRREPRLEGTAVFAHDGQPCEMAYIITCDSVWHTLNVDVTGHVGGVRQSLFLERSPDGAWTVDGESRPDLDGCLDVDLGFSPSTNLLPIRRLDLDVGASANVSAAWVRFPELTVEVLEQTYTRVADDVYRYESAGGTFGRDLYVHESGFVLSYPELWEAERVLVVSHGQNSLT
jgi:hypothetical protein